MLHPEQAETLVTYQSDYMSGKPAVTVNAFSSGHAYYLGTGLSDDLLSRLFQDICQKADIKPTMVCPVAGVKIVRRSKGPLDLLFIINHNPSAVSIDLDGSYANALTDEPLSGTVEIQANGELILANG